MSKELAELSFEELVKMGVGKELDAIIKGESLHSRVHALVELGVRWRYEKSKLDASK